MSVSEHDRRAMGRQAAALDRAVNDDEDATWLDAAIDDADRHRAAEGRPPLEPWWSAKTETELHERARALGLLARAR